MKKCSTFLCFLLLLCVISFSLGSETICKRMKSNRIVYKCSYETFLEPLNLRGAVTPATAELDLSTNKLALSDGCFSPYHGLETLNLSDTSISRISKNFFRGLKNLKILDLSNNNLEMLQPDVFDEMDSLTEVRLHNNKWDCACKKGLMTFLNSKPKISLGPVAPLCDKPAPFKKTTINQHCDKNACSQENDCDDMATCRDFPFNYTCECSTKGFQGTGKECTDIDECARKNDCAKIGGKCINTHGSYKCSCKAGFTGNGKTCADMDECQDHDCVQGECTNSEGSFTCDCYEGYAVNDKKICVDIDECKINNHTCDVIEHSYCLNVEKFLPSDDGYHCLCETGYRKVGKSCVLEGNMKEWVKFLAMIIGGFVGSLFLIIICTVVFLKWKNRKPKSEEEENQVVVAPVVGMGPPVDFAYLGMPQTEQEGQEEEEWGDVEEDD